MVDPSGRLVRLGERPAGTSLRGRGDDSGGSAGGGTLLAKGRTAVGGRTTAMRGSIQAARRAPHRQRGESHSRRSGSQLARSSERVAREKPRWRESRDAGHLLALTRSPASRWMPSERVAVLGKSTVGAGSSATFCASTSSRPSRGRLCWQPQALLPCERTVECQSRAQRSSAAAVRENNADNSDPEEALVAGCERQPVLHWLEAGSSTVRCAPCSFSADRLGQHFRSRQPGAARAVTRRVPAPPFFQNLRSTATSPPSVGECGPPAFTEHSAQEPQMAGALS